MAQKRGQTNFLIFDLQVTDMDVVFEVIGQLESFQISREELEVTKSYVDKNRDVCCCCCRNMYYDMILDQYWLFYNPIVSYLINQIP